LYEDRWFTVFSFFCTSVAALAIAWPLAKTESSACKCENG
jgi:hypothetical protein